MHFLQVWILLDKRGLAPKYGQQAFDRERAKRAFVLLASRDGVASQSVENLNQDVIRGSEKQVWFLSEHLVDVPLVKAD